jgi:hypothetical protein
MKTVTLRIMVSVPTDVHPNDVAEAINARLDEPPCDWGVWTVGGAEVVKEKFERDEMRKGP